MKIIPVVKCRNMQESLSFYSRILGFEPRFPSSTMSSPVIDIINGDAEIQLSVLPGDSVFGCAVNVMVDDVDNLFKTFIQKGLDTSNKKESPVHQGPINQTWGTREFYVDDPNGNTLRFRQVLK